MKPNSTIIAIICFVCFFTQVKAQNNNEPTLEQTMDFIKMKSYNNKVVLFTNTDGNNDKTDSDGKCNFMSSIIDISIPSENRMYLKSSSGEKILLYLSLIESVELIEREYYSMIKLSSSSSAGFYSYYSYEDNISSTHSNDKYLYFLYLKEDAPKVFKAWKHLLKLKGVKLTDDLF